MKTPFLAAVSLLIVSLALASCTIGKAMLPAQSKGFVQIRPHDAEGVISDRTPFHYTWREPIPDQHRLTVRKTSSYRLYVKPVGIEYLSFRNNEEKLQSRAESVAAYLHKKITEKIDEEQDSEFAVTLVETEDLADFILELQLTEISYGSPFLYAAAWAVPFPGVANTYDAMHSATLAVEGRFIDATTKKIVAEMMDRKIPKIRILDLNKTFSRIAPLHDICDDLAVEISKTISTRLDQDSVKGTAPFTLLLW